MFIPTFSYNLYKVVSPNLLGDKHGEEEGWGIMSVCIQAAKKF